MPDDEERIKALPDGRKVKFVYNLPEDGAFITAQIAGNEVVYSVLLTKARNPLSREDVKSHFEGELSKKSRHSIPILTLETSDSNPNPTIPLRA
jgi:hypothetical protein